MVNIHWKFKGLFRKLGRRFHVNFVRTKLCFNSLFYNEFADKYYIGDTTMEPMFWVVDHFTKILGPICVGGVLILMASVISIAYIIGLPFWLQQGIIPTTILLIVGNWILINVLFNYFMAYIVPPGCPPQGALIPEAVSICKKCISPKPPRTHHCSICNICILKMDHHCPWLNNCIGHFNHRYFFMFCAYVWIGIVFIIIFGLPIAWIHFSTVVEPLNFTVMNELNSQSGFDINVSLLTEELKLNKRVGHDSLYHFSIIYTALLAIAVLIAVGALLVWHSRLISKGETSIEGHINKKERKRLSALGKVFKNPYDYGGKMNWHLFLGIHDGRTWWHIIFPSTHKPAGTGLQWNSQKFMENKRNGCIKDLLCT